MAKVITQQTFDEVVKENILEFSMTAEESKEESVKQFEAQGINLANIIKTLDINDETGEPILNESVEKLKLYMVNDAAINESEVIKDLEILYNECKKSVPHRVLAAKLGGYDAVVSILEKSIKSDSIEIIKKSLLAGISLTDKQPDIFDDKLMKLILDILEKELDNKCSILAMRLLSRNCVLHEINRQNIMKTKILIYLKKFVKEESPEASIIKEVCGVFRGVILDDDIRIEFGKAHDHAREIAGEVLGELTVLLQKFKTNQDLICDLLLTIACLTVRNEYCLVIEEAGGLTFILDAMVEFATSIKVVREALKLLKALAGNDKVKVDIIKHGAAPLITNALDTYKYDEKFARVALACISSLTLKSVENSSALFNSGISEVIIDTMKQHEESSIVQRNGSWAIRNMVARSREQCATFITHGAEEVLNKALKKHTPITHDIKSALRDLECKVQLNEEWKGNSEIQLTN